MGQVKKEKRKRTYSESSGKNQKTKQEKTKTIKNKNLQYQESSQRSNITADPHKTNSTKPTGKQSKKTLKTKAQSGPLDKILKNIPGNFGPLDKFLKNIPVNFGPLNKLMKNVSGNFSLKFVYDLIFSPQYLYLAACLFLVLEAAMNIFIIENVKYTEIDWKAYMEEVEGFLNGTWDYSQLKGGTGPLVYPAGFVYVFSALYYLTDMGTNVYLAQYIFAGIYLLTLALVFRIYIKSKKLPPYILFFICCMSYRIHSIYVLRLFNDPVAMAILYGAINCFMSGKWSIGSLLFSLAVSVKMNILLFAPALLMAYIYSLGWMATVGQLLICLCVQVILAVPFLLTNPYSYIVQSFNISRVFLFEWTVNWRFLPQTLFVDTRFHLGLLAIHGITLGLVAFSHWNRYLVHFEPLRKSGVTVSCQLLLLPLFMSNFIGVAVSRSLHYQFYIWYYHSIPYLLWSTRLGISLRLWIMGILELSWNTFPSTWWSSSLMHFCHLIIFCALVHARPTREKCASIKKKLTKGE